MKRLYHQRIASSFQAKTSEALSWNLIICETTHTEQRIVVNDGNDVQPAGIAFIRHPAAFQVLAILFSAR